VSYQAMVLVGKRQLVYGMDGFAKPRTVHVEIEGFFVRAGRFVYWLRSLERTGRSLTETQQFSQRVMLRGASLQGSNLRGVLKAMEPTWLETMATSARPL
jgi:hypothetical protein